MPKRKRKKPYYEELTKQIQRLEGDKIFLTDMLKNADASQVYNAAGLFSNGGSKPDYHWPSYSWKIPYVNRKTRYSRGFDYQFYINQKENAMQYGSKASNCRFWMNYGYRNVGLGITGVMIVGWCLGCIATSDNFKKIPQSMVSTYSLVFLGIFSLFVISCIYKYRSYKKAYDREQYLFNRCVSQIQGTLNETQIELDKKIKCLKRIETNEFKELLVNGYCHKQENRFKRKFKLDVNIPPEIRKMIVEKLEMVDDDLETENKFLIK